MKEELENLLNKIINTDDLTLLIADLFQDTSDVEGLFEYADKMFNMEKEPINNKIVQKDTATDNFSFDSFLKNFGIELN